MYQLTSLGHEIHIFDHRWTILLTMDFTDFTSFDNGQIRGHLYSKIYVKIHTFHQPSIFLDCRMFIYSNTPDHHCTKLLHFDKL